MNNIKFFQENKYCIVKSALTEESRDLITQYALFDEMQNYKPDGLQVPNAHSKYADPAMESVLLYLQKTMEENTGLTLYPTYSYYRVYRHGDKLETHVDRESCEISATLCFNYSYLRENYIWPIYVEMEKIDLHPGDMMIYKGCEVAHMRKTFEMIDDWHVQGFFHYVDVNGPYKEYKFDKRDSIGELRNTNKYNPKKSYIEWL
jgi:hypothetical protein